MMLFHWSYEGCRYGVEYDPSTGRGYLAVASIEEEHEVGDFLLAPEVDEVAWTANAYDAVGPNFNRALATALRDEEPVVCVAVTPHGWSRTFARGGQKTPQRKVVQTWLTRHHVYPVPGILDGDATWKTSVDTLVACEAIDAGMAPHPSARSELLGLDRPLYGTLVVVAQRKGLPVSMPWDLADAVERAFDALSPAEKVLQAVRHAADLRRQGDVSWTAVEAAVRGVWEAVGSYEYAVKNSALLKAGPRGPGKV